MDEKQDKPDKPTSVKPESVEENKPKLREISKEQLKQILWNHEIWLEPEYKGGKCADLSYTNLQGASLEKANLMSANLQGADLQWAILKKANLMGANLQNTEISRTSLSEAILIEADFTNANLKVSNLQKADFTGAKGLSKAKFVSADFDGAKGLLGSDFATKDITGTRLPEDLHQFKILEVVEETSKNARKMFFAMLLGCVYSWLTIATTTDVRLLTNSATSPLPVIGTEIPIAYFYWAAPFVLLGLYLYFHFYLDNLWKGLASLPAIFPDGKPLDQRAYPWLLNCIVCRHFELLKDRTKLAHMKEWVTIFLAWWAVPLTFVGFWFRYLYRHEWLGTWLHIILFSVTVVLSMNFYRICAKILRREEKNTNQSKKKWKRFYHFLIPITVGLLLIFISYDAIIGFNMPRIRANFNEKNVSEKPTDYYRIPERSRLESVKGGNLKNRNLVGANMAGAFLVKADLRKANLSHANLTSANLQYSDFTGADLQHVDLNGANLQHADLISANLQGAYFEDADLSAVDLTGANLQDADLSGTRNLMNHQYPKVYTLHNAKLRSRTMEYIKQNYPHLLEKPKND